MVVRRCLEWCRSSPGLALSISGLALLVAASIWLDTNTPWGSSTVFSTERLWFSFRRDPVEGPAPGQTCFDYAQSQPQPYAAEYSRPKVELAIDPGNIPPVYYQWEGPISREEFDKAEEEDGTRVFFKIFDGQLYVRQSGHGWSGLVKKRHIKFRYKRMVDMLLLTCFLTKIGDVDFVVEFEDSLTCGVPALTYSVHPTCSKGGFAIPSYSAFSDSLGQEQISALHRCLDSRYPTASRHPVAVWRGSTTGSVLTKDNYLMNTRVRLALLGRFHRDTMNVGLSNYVQVTQKNTT